MGNDSIIILKNVEKAYGRTQALRGVNLEVKRGEILGFLGPNGAGKTTTIRCMLDMIRPQKGAIQVLGMNPREDAVSIHSQTGYLPGELNLDGNVKVSEALDYFADLRGNRVDLKFVAELSRKLELDLDKQIKNLSKGNKQKVGIVQALMHRPALLLMDEPTSGLDPLMQQVVYRLLREAREMGATIFFSSHIISEVEALADRVAIIRGGTIIEEAKPSELTSMALRRVHLRFRMPVDTEKLARVQGVRLITKSNGSATFHVEGAMESLIRELANYPVVDLETERPSLEELFLDYYREENREV